jgi:hypothetical protein
MWTRSRKFSPWFPFPALKVNGIRAARAADDEKSPEKNFCVCAKITFSCNQPFLDV